MQVSNVRTWSDIDFDEYQKLKGLSYSGIKGGNFVSTPKMQLGTSVHNYLLEPAKYNHENRAIVDPLVNALKAEIGDILPHMDKELSISADFSYDGLTMGYKGRIDMVVPGKIVIDLKVSEHPLANTIPYFGYDNQVNGYMAASRSNFGMIIRINPVTKKIEKKAIVKNTAFWELQIAKYGIPSFLNH